MNVDIQSTVATEKLHNRTDATAGEWFGSDPFRVARGIVLTVWEALGFLPWVDLCRGRIIVFT